MLALSLDPFDILTHLLSKVLGHFIDTGRTDIVNALNIFLFTTVDSTRPGGFPITSNPDIQGINGTLALAGDIILAAALVFAFLRLMFDHSGLRSKYSFRYTLSRAMLAVILMHGSLMFMQMAIDLNNALGHVALNAQTVNPDNLPWGAPLSAPAVHNMSAASDLFHLVFDIILVVALVLLALAYVVRTALLNVLIAIAPLAALCVTLPETKSYARTWLRLFLASVFMQAVQLVVLRVAMLLAFDHGAGLITTLYAIATLWLMLKVPGAMNTASHLDTKAKTEAHDIEKHLLKALHPAHHARSAA